MLKFIIMAYLLIGVVYVVWGAVATKGPDENSEFWEMGLEIIGEDANFFRALHERLGVFCVPMCGICWLPIFIYAFRKAYDYCVKNIEH